jgi:hypothetical protein
MSFRLVLAFGQLSHMRKKLQQLREHAAYSICGGRLLPWHWFSLETQLKARRFHLLVET